MKAYLLAWILRHLGIYHWRWISVQDRGSFRIGFRTYNWSNGRITSDRDDFGPIRRGVDGRVRVHGNTAGQRWRWPR